jgi:hypothetical protein
MSAEGAEVAGEEIYKAAEDANTRSVENAGGH